MEDTRREMDKLISDIRSIKGVDRSAADRVIQQSRDALRKRRDDLAENWCLTKRTAPSRLRQSILEIRSE